MPSGRPVTAKVYYPDDVRDMARQTSVQDPDVLRRIAELSEREREVLRP